MIVIYTTATCASCHMVEKLLNMRKIGFQKIGLDDNPSLRQELINKTGAMTVPIITNGERYVVGYNPAEIIKLATT